MGNEENKVISLTENDNWKQRLSIELVDQLADGLVKEYDNPQFRAWYCKLIYTFGPAQIQEWQGRVRDSAYPAKLFSKLAAEGLRAKEVRERLNG